MYADRHAQTNRFNPAGLTAAIAINAAVIAGLMFSSPTIIAKLPGDPLTLIDVHTPEPPPPEPVPDPPTPPRGQQPVERIDTPIPLVKPVASAESLVPTMPSLPPAGTDTGVGTGPVVIADPLPPPPLPVLVDPAFDPRYASAIQPIYPAAERRAEHEGRVTIRVLVGIDGRVKQAERISATSDAFWQATRERALSAWRFKPGTRGGIPVEAWRTLTLTFVLEQ